MTTKERNTAIGTATVPLSALGGLALWTVLSNQPQQDYAFGQSIMYIIVVIGLASLAALTISWNGFRSARAELKMRSDQASKFAMYACGASVALSVLGGIAVVIMLALIGH